MAAAGEMVVEEEIPEALAPAPYRGFCLGCDIELPLCEPCVWWASSHPFQQAAIHDCLGQVVVVGINQQCAKALDRENTWCVVCAAQRSA
jgi:hypothetical protein